MRMPPWRVLSAALTLLLASQGCTAGKSLKVERVEPEGDREISRGSTQNRPPETPGGGSNRGRGGPVVRVAVARTGAGFTLSAEEALVQGGGKNLRFRGKASLTVKEGAVVLRGETVEMPASVLSSGTVQLNGRTHSGELVVYPDIVVNLVPLDEYLRGVVNSEIPESWPLEALKAQTVVSRTYTARRILDRRGELYDVDDSEMYQKYEYVENKSVIEKAIHSTGDTILTYQGEPIEALFHANSGGVTESARDVFQRDFPYLRSIRDPYTVRNDPAEWEMTLTAAALKKRLERVEGAGIPASPLGGVRIRSTTGSGRASEFLVTFVRNEELLVKGNAFRIALDPKSFKSLLLTGIETRRENGETIFTFSGKGYGHGVGMSQTGARWMAEEGFSYRQILAFYYRGTRLERWDGP